MKLKHSEIMHRSMFDVAPTGIGLIDTDGAILVVNKSLSDLLGYRQDELNEGKLSFVDFFSDDCLEYKLFFSLLKKEKELKNYIGLLKRKTGETAPVLINATAVALDGKECFELILLDIAGQEQNRSAAGLEKDELELLRFITDNGAGEIYLVRQDMTLSYVNNSVCKSLGYPRNDVLQMKVSDFDLSYNPRTCKDHLEVWKEYFNEMRDSRKTKTTEARHVDRHGNIRVKEISSRYIESQSRGKDYILGIGIDITEHRELEKELAKSEKRFQLLFELAPDGILGMSADEKIIFWNQAAKKIFQYSDKELKDMPVHQLFSNAQGILHIKESLKQGHDSIKIESIIRKRDGDTFPASITLWAERDLTGKVLCIYGIFRDIKQAKQLEMERLELEKLSTTRVLLKKSEQEKAELEENTVQNINTLLLPILDKLKSTQSLEVSQNYLALLEENLEKITSPFLKKLSNHYQRFSPREIEVANLIKNGRSTKEISDALLLTPAAINFHRKNLRKKLGLSAKKQNLQVFLKSLS